jgi:hypothetical protein
LAPISQALSSILQPLSAQLVDLLATMQSAAAVTAVVAAPASNSANTSVERPPCTISSVFGSSSSDWHRLSKQLLMRCRRRPIAMRYILTCLECSLQLARRHLSTPRVI